MTLDSQKGTDQAQEEPFFDKLLAWAKETHPALPWDEFEKLADADESLIALLTFLEENDVEVGASGLTEQSHPGEGWRPNDLNLIVGGLKTAFFLFFNRAFLKQLAQILPDFAKGLKKAPMQIEGENLSEEARLYRASRGRLAYSDEYQERAEAELPEGLKRLAKSNRNRKKALEEIAFRLAEAALAEKGITKPSELA